MKQKPRLTNRLLSAIQQALIAVEAGAGEPLSGYALTDSHDAEFEKLYAACLDALDWTHAMMRYRAAKKASRAK